MSEIVKSNTLLYSGIIFLAIFATLTIFVFISSALQRFDTQLALAINNTNLGSSITKLMILASQYGREYFWIPITAIMLIFGKSNTKLLAIELIALFVVGIVAGEILKYALFRARPYSAVNGINLRVTASTDSSYPSGHVLIVSIGAIFIISKFKRKIIPYLFVIEAIIVCYSRVYVGLHYPIDVFSGIVLASAIVFLGTFVMEKYLKGLIESIARIVVKIFAVLHIPEYI